MLTQLRLERLNRGLRQMDVVAMCPSTAFL